MYFIFLLTFLSLKKLNWHQMMTLVFALIKITFVNAVCFAPEVNKKILVCCKWTLLLKSNWSAKPKVSFTRWLCTDRENNLRQWMPRSSCSLSTFVVCLTSLSTLFVYFPNNSCSLKPPRLGWISKTFTDSRSLALWQLPSFALCCKNCHLLLLYWQWLRACVTNTVSHTRHLSCFPPLVVAYYKNKCRYMCNIWARV